jgi:hypothetical protein
MRKISVIGAIAAVPTMTVGISGTSFEHMPDQSSTYGNPAALAVMVSAVHRADRGLSPQPLAPTPAGRIRQPPRGHALTQLP